jgi:hypothetical protein
VVALLSYVGYRGRTGKHFLILSFTGFQGDRMTTLFLLRCMSSVLARDMILGMTRGSSLMTRAFPTEATWRVISVRCSAPRRGEFRSLQR